jgi:hypothetical protein
MAIGCKIFVTCDRKAVNQWSFEESAGAGGRYGCSIIGGGGGELEMSAVLSKASPVGRLPCGDEGGGGGGGKVRIGWEPSTAK